MGSAVGSSATVVQGGCGPGGSGSISQSTPGTYSFVVPCGVTSITVDLVGGKGANSTFISTSIGGLPGRVQATIAVIPGHTIFYRVGASATTITGGVGAAGAGSGGNGYNP